MSIRGRAFVRKHDVQHLIIRGSGAAQTFQASVGFAIPAKRDKLDDLTWVSTSLESGEEYSWFLAHYEQRGRKWLRKDNHGNNS